MARKKATKATKAKSRVTKRTKKTTKKKDRGMFDYSTDPMNVW